MLMREEMPTCPVATTVELSGSKWKLLIIRNLLVRPWRFNELKKDGQRYDRDHEPVRNGLTRNPRS